MVEPLTKNVIHRYQDPAATLGGCVPPLRMPKKQNVPKIYFGTRTHKQVSQIVRDGVSNRIKLGNGLKRIFFVFIYNDDWTIMKYLFFTF